MKKILLFTLLLAGFTAFSQGTVTGTVVDSDLGGGLPSSNIMEIGTANGSISDFDGNFTLSVSSNTGKLEITYVGYIKKTVSYTLTNGTARSVNPRLPAISKATKSCCAPTIPPPQKSIPMKH